MDFSLRESSADGSLSDRSVSSNNSDVTMISSKGVGMPKAQFRRSKPELAAKPATVLFPDGIHQVTYPRELDQWMDMVNSTVVKCSEDRYGLFQNFARYVAKVEAVSEQADARVLRHDSRCGDIFKCRACYPTEEDVQSALGEFAEARPVCIHADSDTKFDTFAVPGEGVWKVTFGEETLWYCNLRRGLPQNAGRELEVYTEEFFVVPGRDRAIVVQRLMVAIYKVYQRTLETPIQKERVIRIYRWTHQCKCWDRKMNVTARTIQSVIIPQDAKDRIVSDLDRFFSKETALWYEKHGLPYKRSLLFHGLPGTGKTSLITALAAKYERNVCFLQPQHPEFTDDLFKTCMERVPRRAIVILEDIDALFEGREKARGSACPLTFSGLLNALDGMTYEAGCVFVMTTNHIEKLDPALIRAGRCDIKIHFTFATDWQLEKFFLKFYPDAGKATCELFVKNTKARFPNGTVLAETQQHFIDHMFADAETCARAMLDYVLVPPVEKKPEENEDEEEDKKDSEEEKGDKGDAEEEKGEKGDADGSGKKKKGGKGDADESKKEDGSAAPVESSTVKASQV